MPHKCAGRVRAAQSERMAQALRRSMRLLSQKSQGAQSAQPLRATQSPERHRRQFLGESLQEDTAIGDQLVQRESARVLHESAAYDRARQSDDFVCESRAWHHVQYVLGPAQERVCRYMAEWATVVRGRFAHRPRVYA